MSKESMLQRDIKERDLQRMRNLITKKFTDALGSQVGYKKQLEEHEEGEVWNESGKQWTVKDGIKMTVSRLSKVKKSMQLPLVCPKCNNPLRKPELDKKMYFIHGFCFDCTIENETNLRKEGKYEEYENKLINGNINSYIEELQQIFEEYLLNINDSIVTEDGVVERWVGGNMDKEKEIKQFQEYINKLQNMIKNSPSTD